LAGDESGPGVAALEESRLGVEEQAALELLALLGVGGVAGVALLDEDGADLLLEEGGSRGVLVGGEDRRGGQGEADEAEQEAQSHEAGPPVEGGGQAGEIGAV